MPSAICFNLDMSEILSSGNGLNPVFTERGFQVTDSIKLNGDLCHLFESLFVQPFFRSLVFVILAERPSLS